MLSPDDIAGILYISFFIFFVAHKWFIKQRRFYKFDDQSSLTYYMIPFLFIILCDSLINISGNFFLNLRQTPEFLQPFIQYFIWPLFIFLFYFFWTSEKYIKVRQIDYFNCIDTNTIFVSTGLKPDISEIEKIEGTLDYIKRNGVEFNKENYVFTPYRSSRSHPLYLGGINFQRYIRILALPITVKFASAIIYIVFIFLFVAVASDLEDNYVAGLIAGLFQTFVSEEWVIEIAKKVYITIEDLFYLIVLPTIDLLPIIFGGAFFNYEWKVLDIPLNAIAFFSYILLILLLVTPISNLSSRLRFKYTHEILSGLIFINGALTILFIWTKLDWYIDGYSYERAIEFYKRDRREVESYISYIISGSTVGYISSAISLILGVIIPYLKIPLTILWFLLFSVLGSSLDDRFTAIKLFGYVKKPEFLEQRLAFLKEQKRLDDLEKVRTEQVEKPRIEPKRKKSLFE